MRGFGFKGTGTPNTRADLCKTWEVHKISVTLLAAIAEFERELIRERTGDGRKRAMANGVKFGRKPKLSPFQRAEAIKRRGSGRNSGFDRKDLRGRPLDDLAVVNAAPRPCGCRWRHRRSATRKKHYRPLATSIPRCII